MAYFCCFVEQCQYRDWQAAKEYRHRAADAQGRAETSRDQDRLTWAERSAKRPGELAADESARRAAEQSQAHKLKRKQTMQLGVSF